MKDEILNRVRKEGFTPIEDTFHQDPRGWSASRMWSNGERRITIIWHTVFFVEIEEKTEDKKNIMWHGQVFKQQIFEAKPDEIDLLEEIKGFKL